MSPVVALDGVQAVQARIGQIEARFGAPGRTGTAAAGPSRFDAVLAAELAGLGGTATAPTRSATAKAPGAYGPLAPPAELAAFGNGCIPPDRLVPIGDGSERLYGPAAEAFKRMASAAWRAGVDLEVNDGYRSFDQQQAVAAEVGLFRDGGRAAVPGTSTHGWGLSVDVGTGGGALEWLRANAPRYGFVEDVPREPWHWTFRPDA